MRDYLELVRAPAALTVLGDSLVGSAAAGRGTSGRTLLLPLASACLYAGGMALNDYADRDLDAVERPERPIPSGRISPRRALAVAGGLTAAGLGLATAARGRSALLVAAPLAGAVWAYDLLAKPTPAGPAVMAACRGLDVLLGAGPNGVTAALPSAALVAGHVAGVTALSRGEVRGAARPVPGAALATTSIVGSLATRPYTGQSWLSRVGATAAAGWYATTAGGPQAAAVQNPSAGPVRDATRAGIGALIPLQSALIARAGAPVVAAAVAGLSVAGTALRRRMAAGDVT